MLLTRCFAGVLIAVLTTGSALANPVTQLQQRGATSDALETLSQRLIVRRVPAQRSQQALAATIGELQSLVKPSETITVTDVNGRKTTGKIGKVSDSSLELLVESDSTNARTPQSVTLPAASIRTVRKEDRVWNGVGIGLAVGALSGIAWCCAAGGEDAGILAPVVGLFFGGIGAAIGAIVDVSNHHDKMYFDRSGGTSRVTLAPILTDHQRGVLVSWSSR